MTDSMSETMDEIKVTDVEAVVEIVDDSQWKSGHKAWSIVMTLALVSLIVALDATILVTALPVRPR